MRRELATDELRWIDITDPTKDDLRFLRDTMGFHPLDVAECQHPTHLPKVELHPTYLFLVIHVPVYVAKARVSIPVEFDVFVRGDAVVTCHSGSAKILEKLFRNATKDAAVRERMLGRGTPYLLYGILNHLFDASFPMLNHIAVKLERAERRIFNGEERHMVAELSLIQRDLGSFRSIVRPQRYFYGGEALQGEWVSPSLQIVFRGLHAKLTRWWEYLETLWERSESLVSTNGALLDHKLNEFVKLLTILGAVFIPLGLIAQVVIFIDRAVSTTNLLIFWGLIVAMFVIDIAILWRARNSRVL